MTDEAGKTDGEGKGGSDEFDPKSLSPEAQEFIRKAVQSESDSKSSLVEKKLRDEQAMSSRQAVETAEQNELNRLAQAGDYEGLGTRVAARLNQRSVEEAGIVRASDLIEKQLADKFAETLGTERVEEIRREVVDNKGAHAEFAKALADAQGGGDRQKEIQAEVKAALIEAGVAKRDDEAGPDKAAGSGQGPKTSTFDDIEKAYVAGTLPGGREAYREAREADQKGR